MRNTQMYKVFLQYERAVNSLHDTYEWAENCVMSMLGNASLFISDVYVHAQKTVILH